MEKYIKKADNVPSRNVGTEVLLLNLKDGNYFGLNATGMIIWKMLDGTKTRSDILKTLKQKFHLKEDVARRDLTVFLSELKKNHLIVFLP